MASWDKMIDLGNYGQSNHNWGGMHINPAVFFPTAFISFAVIMFSLIAPKASADLFAALRGGASTFACSWSRTQRQAMHQLKPIFYLGGSLQPLQ